MGIRFIILLAALVCIALTGQNVCAGEYMVAGRPLRMTGFMSQGLEYGLQDERHFDTFSKVQSTLTTLFLEGDYKLSPEWRFYSSGLLAVNWVYDIYNDDVEWLDKGFNKSRSNLYFDDDYWQILSEAHISWSPEDFFFRFGKQVVSWGETDGFRLIDQINPLDQRRGFADVEFENTILPIWLFRGEWNTSLPYESLSEAGIQFVFNPNIDFIPDQPIAGGNDKGGIWAPDFVLGPGLLLGSTLRDVPEPDANDGFEYGLKLSGLLYDTFVTLNAFYGRDNSAVTRLDLASPTIETAFDGTSIAHFPEEGFYPRFRFVGMTLNTSLGYKMTNRFLSNIPPVLRAEGFWAKDNTFVDAANNFVKHDEIRWALALDTKLNIPFINPKAKIAFTPQFQHQRIMDFPEGALTASGGSPKQEKDLYTVTAALTTTYVNGRVRPLIFWLRDIETRSDLFKFSVSWDRSHTWTYSTGILIFEGREENAGFDLFENKDQVFFKVTYKWF